jgi:NitT/TauT family transport system ATP-binding protein
MHFVAPLPNSNPGSDADRESVSALSVTQVALQLHALSVMNSMQIASVLTMGSDVGAIERQATAPAIQLSATSVTFGQGASATSALSETNLAIADGEFLALVGPSGCG